MTGQIDIDLSIDGKGTVTVRRYDKKAAEVMSQREFELLSGFLIKTCANLSLGDCIAAVGKIIHQRRKRREKLRALCKSLQN